MPIRPENVARYPKDWKQISYFIREIRAGGQCECEGECGRGTHAGRCPNRHGRPAYGTGSRVVLTTAHLNHEPEDCRPENLRAMCQGCHLHYDRDHHAETARATKAAVAASWMQPMFGEPDDADYVIPAGITTLADIDAYARAVTPPDNPEGAP